MRELIRDLIQTLQIVEAKAELVRLIKPLCIACRTLEIPH